MYISEEDGKKITAKEASLLITLKEIADLVNKDYKSFEQFEYLINARGLDCHYAEILWDGRPGLCEPFKDRLKDFKKLLSDLGELTYGK